MAAWGLDPLFPVHVRVFCSQVHRMRESKRTKGVYFLGEHPVQRACILGYIIGAMRRPRNVTYIGARGWEWDCVAGPPLLVWMLRAPSDNDDAPHPLFPRGNMPVFSPSGRRDRLFALHRVAGQRG